MSHHTVYTGDLAFWKVPTPPETGEDKPISDGDDFHTVYHAMLNEVEDTRLLQHSIGDSTTYNNSMGFDISEHYEEINPRTALDSVRDAAQVLGKWGIYLDGTVFCFVDQCGYMFHMIVTKERARLFRYEHQADTFKGPNPKVELVLVREHDLSGFVDPKGVLPLSKSQEKARKEERKRKRQKEEEEYDIEDQRHVSWKHMMKGDSEGR
jgi:hypothetical protein